ncbi:MAG: KOW motif-containing protein, partial [Methylobacter tundripaludum]|nr:KOW motif-containing protein [Methylobacter tundripaludum]
MQRIKQGDEVIVRTGKDKGKSGRVSKVLKDNKVLVEGINQV